MNIFPDFTPHCITIMCKQLNSADFRHFIVDELAYYDSTNEWNSRRKLMHSRQNTIQKWQDFIYLTFIWLTLNVLRNIKLCGIEIFFNLYKLPAFCWNEFINICHLRLNSADLDIYILEVAYSSSNEWM